MELVRDLLKLIEGNKNIKELIVPKEMDRLIVAKHLKIMEQAGLVEDKTLWASNSPMWINATLTWNGHEYLDAIKNDTVWNNIKENLKEKGLQITELSFSLLKDYAVAEGKRILGIG